MYKDKNIALAGYGRENEATLQYLVNQGARVTICDQNSDLEVPVRIRSKLGDKYLDELDKFDLVVRSPSMEPEKLKGAKKTTTAVKIFFQNCKGTIIGVTGTKGKGTTSTLISKILTNAGKNVYLGGNIGVPVLSFLGKVKKGDFVVLELSSYQLVDLDVSPHIAVCLAINNDHVAFHGSHEAYIDAKTNIFRFQTKEDIAVYHKLNSGSSHAATFSLGEKRPYFDNSFTHISEQAVWFENEEICKVNEVGLIGTHNLENVAAAINATRNLVSSVHEISNPIRDFKGLPHRLEHVAEIDGRVFVNDSFAVGPEASVAAVNTFVQPKVLIWGGYDKGLDYTDAAITISDSNVRHVVLIGQIADQMKIALESAGYTNYSITSKNLFDAVGLAYKHSQAGDVILLSPGTSSFDMFKNFEDRGNQFKNVVSRFAELALKKSDLNQI